jgi:hypothetical protein
MSAKSDRGTAASTRWNTRSGRAVAHDACADLDQLGTPKNPGESDGI